MIKVGTDQMITSFIFQIVLTEIIKIININTHLSVTLTCKLGWCYTFKTIYMLFVRLDFLFDISPLLPLQNCTC